MYIKSFNVEVQRIIQGVLSDDLPLDCTLQFLVLFKEYKESIDSPYDSEVRVLQVLSIDVESSPVDLEVFKNEYRIYLYNEHDKKHFGVSLQEYIEYLELPDNCQYLYEYEQQFISNF